MLRHVVLAEVHDCVRTLRHFLPHEASESLEVHDESTDRLGRHDLRASAGLAKARFLLLPPLHDPLEAVWALLE